MNNTIYPGKRLLTQREFCEYTGLGRTKGNEWAREIGAITHVGRRVLFDRFTIDRAIDESKKHEE